MLSILKVNQNDLPDSLGCSVFSNFVTSRRCVYEKLEKQPFLPFWGRPKRLLVCHAASKSEMLGLLCRVIVPERGKPRASSELRINYWTAPSRHAGIATHLDTQTLPGRKEET